MKHIEVYVHQKYSAERRIIFNSLLSVSLACITGALWAKRDERGILREVGDEGRRKKNKGPVTEVITSPLFWLFCQHTPTNFDWRRWCQKDDP